MSLFSNKLYNEASGTVKFHPRYGPVEGESKNTSINQGNISSAKAYEVILLSQREASNNSIISINGNYIDLSSVPTEGKSERLLLYIKNAVSSFFESNSLEPLSEKNRLRLSNLIIGAMLATNIDDPYQQIFMSMQMHIGKYADRVKKEIAGYLKIGNQTNSKGEILDKKSIAITFVPSTKYSKAHCKITYQVAVNLRREDEKVVGTLERKGVTKIPLSLVNNGTTTFSVKMKVRKGKKSANKNYLGDKSVRGLMAKAIPHKLRILTRDPHVMGCSAEKISKLLEEETG